MAKPRKNKQPQADGLTREGLVIKNTGSWYDVLTNPADDADGLLSLIHISEPTRLID